MLFEFPFSLVGKSTMAFPTGLWRIQGKDPGPPPLIFGPNKSFLGTPAPTPPSYLRVWMTGPPPYLKVWMRHCRRNPSTQMEAQSMDFGAVSQTDLTRVTFGPWRRLVRSGGQSKNKICFISPAHGARYVISQVKSCLATLLTVLVYSGFRMMKLEYTCYVLERSNEIFSYKEYNF